MTHTFSSAAARTKAFALAYQAFANAGKQLVKDAPDADTKAVCQYLVAQMQDNATRWAGKAPKPAAPAAQTLAAAQIKGKVPAPRIVPKASRPWESQGISFIQFMAEKNAIDALARHKGNTALLTPKQRTRLQERSARLIATDNAHAVRK